MIKVIGVRFREAGKVYYFAPGELDIKRDQHVIVETARGMEYGTVVLGVSEVEDDKVIQPLKSVIRLATPEDDEREALNRKKEIEAVPICKEKIEKRGLPMKLINAEYTLITVRFFSIISVMDELTSVNWLKILPACSIHESK